MVPGLPGKSPVFRSTGNKSKNKQVEWHSKEINQQNEKAAYGMGENICKAPI